ncbi:MAG: LamG-like jellyroll fold domain-containing protein [Candidatus Saccharimonadales bacterium]
MKLGGSNLLKLITKQYKSAFTPTSLKLRRVKLALPAFTIVELLVVIVVIGILAAITVVSYNGITNRAIIASIQSDLSNAAQQLKIFSIDNNTYPLTLDCSQPDTNINKCIKSSDATNLYYQSDNSSIPEFCITARNRDIIYKVSENSSPSPGGCLTPGLVDEGLVLNLDGGDPVSYSGSGTSWLDLSENINHATLTNGPTYNSVDSGSIVFDGTNDYVDFYAPNLTTTATVEMWAKIGSAYSSKMFMGWLAYDVFTASGGIGFNTGNSDLYGINSSTVTSLGVVNHWAHYIFEMRSDVSYSNNKIYINSIAQTLSQLLSTENSGTRIFNGGNGRISGWRQNGYYMPMEVSVFRVYNRQLSQAEVTQNFNAVKGRYGL